MNAKRRIQVADDVPQPKARRVVPPQSECPAILHQLPADLFKLILRVYLKPRDTLVLWMCNHATRFRISGCVWKLSLRYPSARIGFTRCVVSLYKWAIKMGNVSLLKWLASMWEPTDWLSPKDVRGCCKSNQFEDVIAWIKRETSKFGREKDSINYWTSYRDMVVGSAIIFGRVGVVLREVNADRRFLDLINHDQLVRTGNVDIIVGVIPAISQPHMPVAPNGGLLQLNGHFVNICGNPVQAAARSGNLDLVREMIKQGFTIGERTLSDALFHKKLNIAQYLLSDEVIKDAIDYARQNKCNNGMDEGCAALLTGDATIISRVLRCDPVEELTTAEVVVHGHISNQITAEFFSWYITTHKRLRGCSPPVKGILEVALRRATIHTSTRCLRMSRQMVDAFIASDIAQAHKDFGKIAKILAWGFHVATLAHLTKAIPPSAGFSYDRILTQMVCGMLRQTRCGESTPKLARWHMAELLKHEYDCDVYAFVSDDVKQHKV